LGAPFGGLARGGHQGFDWLAVGWMTPPNFAGGGGRLAESIDVDASGAPGAALPCGSVTPDGPSARSPLDSLPSVHAGPASPAAASAATVAPIARAIDAALRVARLEDPPCMGGLLRR
jgi:hypothetical protein